MSTLYTYLSRSWRKKPLIAGKTSLKNVSGLYHLCSLTFIFLLLSFIKILLKSLFILQGMNEEWKIFNQDIEYIHISHLKSFQIPVEIQNLFYNISFIFTALHFRESFKFSQKQKIHTIKFLSLSISLLTPTSNNNMCKQARHVA